VIVRAATVTVALLAFGLALAWARITPILQQPDELAHVDYTLALYQHGGPFRIAHAKRSTHATTDARYLLAALDYRRMRYDLVAGAPAGYGSRAYVERIDRGSPARSSWAVRDGSALPYAAFQNPIGSYAFDAALMRARDAAFGPQLFEDVQFVRDVHALALALVLGFAYACFRELGLARGTAAIAAAAAGLLPVSTILFSYVQPDAYTALFTTAALFFAYRAARSDSSVPFASLGVALALLCTVKPFYGSVVAACLLASVGAARWRSRRPLPRAGIVVLAALPLVALALASGTHLYAADRFPPRPVDGPNAHRPLLAAVGAAASNVYAGNAFANFWYQDGIWLSRTFVPRAVVPVLQNVLYAGSAATFALLGIVAYRRVRGAASLSRLGRLASRALAEPALVLYAGWTAFLIAADTYLHNQLGLLGRYWVPVIVPTIALAVVYGARAFPPQRRAAASLAFASAWLGIALVLGAFALDDAVRHYGSPPPPPHPDRFITLETLRRNGTDAIDSFDVTVTRRDRLDFAGWGFDSRAGLPGSGAAVLLDGTRTPLRYGLRTPRYPFETLSDDDLAHVGFRGSLAFTHVAPGTHVLRLVVRDADGTRDEPWLGTLHVHVVR
jgi:hypothetical protein